jgi:hypothetical protein
MALAAPAAARGDGEKAAEKAPAADAELPPWTDARIAERQPAREDKRFDEIGWSRTVLDAERLAKAQRRPLFLFTHDGRMNVGRC